MSTVRRFRGLLMIAAALALIFTMVLLGAKAAAEYLWAYHAPMEPVATPSGIWWVSAVEEPVFAHAWENEQHLLYRIDSWYDRDTQESYSLWVAVDGDTAYQLDTEHQSIRTLATALDIDWSLGADALPYYDAEEDARRSRGSYHLTVHGALYSYGEIIDQNPGFTEKQLAIAAHSSYHIAIPMENSTRVYCSYSNNGRSARQRYDLP